jgi:hypothetical protein
MRRIIVRMFILVVLISGLFLLDDSVKASSCSIQTLNALQQCDNNFFPQAATYQVARYACNANADLECQYSVYYEACRANSIEICRQVAYDDYVGPSQSYNNCITSVNTAECTENPDFSLQRREACQTLLLYEDFEGYDNCTSSLK